MIPKIIHYCWFGGKPLPPLAQKCIKSWKKYCPDYEIIRWDESNFDINCCAYTAAMYEQKRWAFLSDYVRLKILYEYGGIYLDTDVELLESLNDFLYNKAFMGFETTGYVNTGLGFGAERQHSFIGENMCAYENLHDFTAIETCPQITTRLLVAYGCDCESNEIQNMANVTIYPVEYFCAKNYKTGALHITAKTVSIHHFDGSWNTASERKKTKDRWRKYRIERILRAPKVLLRRLLGDQRVEQFKERLHLK